MDENLYDEIRACYLAYVNEKNITKKMYYLELLKEYIRKEKELNLPEFDIMLLNLDRLIHNDLTHINIECRLVSGAPNFEELLVTVGLALDGKIEPEAFKIILQDTLEKIEETQNNLDGALEQLNAEDLELLAHCLDCQALGCRELASWCETGDKQLLKNGWRRISASLPSTKRICAQMKKSLGLDDDSSKKLTCMRCGQQNPASARFVKDLHFFH